MTALPSWLANMRGNDGYFHPDTVADIQNIVKWAAQSGVNLRARGSGHSVPGSIYADNSTQFTEDGGALNIMLDKLTAISPLQTRNGKQVVRVEGGCHLGRDPYDPSLQSTWENSLFWNLNNLGYAFDDMGGIVHQTLAGFTAMGCAGGSLKHDLDSHIIGIEMVDGNGNLQTYFRDDPAPNDAFYAAGVSMGLFGIVTAMWFELVERFWISGTEKTHSLANGTNESPIDLFGDRPDLQSLEAFLRTPDYTRLMWWPQKGIERITVWQANKIPYDDSLQRQPYQELPWLLGSPIPMQAAAGELYTLVGTFPRWLRTLLDPVTSTLSPQQKASKVFTTLFRPLQTANTGKPSQPTFDNIMNAVSAIDGQTTDLKGAIEDILKWAVEHLGVSLEILAVVGIEWSAYELGKISFETMIENILRVLYEPVILPLIITSFISTDENQSFQDYWYGSLPMDNQIDDKLMPVEFTELWIPLDKATQAMAAMRQFYVSTGFPATGSFSTELYATGPSQFFMSPSYNTEVFRVDFFWFGYNDGQPDIVFYPQFWEALKDFGFRFHWAKYLSDPYSETGVAYRRASLPQWDAWQAQRAAHDPKGIFVNRYWKAHLGL